MRCSLAWGYKVVCAQPNEVDFMQTNAQPHGGKSRRDFIKSTATAAAAVAAVNMFKTPVYGQNQAPSPGRVIGANDRIVVGFIGVGGQGMAHVRSQKGDAQANNVALVATCDGGGTNRPADRRNRADICASGNNGRR